MTPSSARWSPDQYLRFAGERLRPFVELIDRIGADEPDVVVDLGCGPGNATLLLADRWPDALIRGIDYSAEMIEEAKSLEVPGHLSFELGDAYTFSDASSVDVLVSNATLHWVPGHVELFAAYIGSLTPGGWFAFQVPSMLGEPSHRLLFDLARGPRWSSRLAHLTGELEVETAERYLDALVALGCEVDAWDTTYYQVLPGEDPILQWTKGAVMRPFLTALDESEGAAFCDEYAALVRVAYPPRPIGTVFPFRRTFVVAHAPGGGST
jgi:trans-aconitate 2-methyltransferase